MCIVIHPILRALCGLFTGTTSSSSAVRVTVSFPPLLSRRSSMVRQMVVVWVVGVGGLGNRRKYLSNCSAARIIVAACDSPFAAANACDLLFAYNSDGMREWGEGG